MIFIGLESRTRQRLRDAGISRVAELIKLSEHDLLGIKGIGEVSVDIIVTWLFRAGLYLMTDTHEYYTREEIQEMSRDEFLSALDAHWINTDPKWREWVQIGNEACKAFASIKSDNLFFDANIKEGDTIKLNLENFFTGVKND